jgi:ATP-binding cassette subfamily B protein
LMRGRTVIAIAHRLATVREFDRILVIEGGRLVQDGSPHDLAARDGHFRNLIRTDARQQAALARRAA